MLSGVVRAAIAVFVAAAGLWTRGHAQAPASSVVADESAEPRSARDLRLSLGFGGGSLGSLDAIASSPNGMGFLVHADVRASGPLRLGLDASGHRGARWDANVPYGYRAFRFLVDVGYEVGHRAVRFTPFIGAGQNVYVLVVDDLRASRSDFVAVYGARLLVHGRRRGFGGLEGRVAQVFHLRADHALLPTAGNFDVVLNGFVVGGVEFDLGR